MKKRKHEKKPVNGFIYYLGTFLLIAAMAGAILLLFAYFHHVRVVEDDGLGLVSSRDGLDLSTPMPTITPSPTPWVAVPGATPTPTVKALSVIKYVTPVPTRTPPTRPETVRTGDFYYDHWQQFTENGEIVYEKTEDGFRYVSGNASITLTSGEYKHSNYYLADIYISDIEMLSVGLANGKYGMGQRDMPEDIEEPYHSLLAINGDYYSVRREGIVIRNGELYRDTQFRDICVLYWDGTMETFAKNKITGKEALANGAYQTWCFGPNLLNTDGSPAKTFSTDVFPANPRTVLGYYEPGHYCFLVVEGRGNDSNGLTLEQLAEFMSELGCKVAYNMDGGQTSTMIHNGKVINYRNGGGRECSDIIMIREPE